MLYCHRCWLGLLAECNDVCVGVQAGADREIRGTLSGAVVPVAWQNMRWPALVLLNAIVYQWYNDVVRTGPLRLAVCSASRVCAVIAVVSCPCDLSGK